ncbi:alpha/beta fold hydrolase [Kitasatospora sp. NBC_00374]|uniref:alpha/beta fold hydrolase n=1 Tax=Kitasatospora sp. NBC_00374 TaxID=2975964 RepID=UPI00324A2DC7
MKLHLHEAGDGDRLALLIHGGMSDHRTWHAVERRLIGLGYRVVDSLPAGADLAIGHSLGGLSLALALARLRPRRAVFSDPGFRLGNLPAGALAVMRSMVETASPASIRTANPRWSEADVAAEVAGFARFDLSFLDGVGGFEEDYLPRAPIVPTLVQLADPSLTIGPTTAGLLEQRGFDVTVVPGAGHCIHRDDLPAFFASLAGWV